MANTFIRAIVAAPASNRSLATAGVVNATSLAGWLLAGNGTALTPGLVLSDGLVLSEAIVLSER